MEFIYNHPFLTTWFISLVVNPLGKLFEKIFDGKTSAKEIDARRLPKLPSSLSEHNKTNIQFLDIKHSFGFEETG
ncbi:hypothetical protein [Salsuginibacillus kocurii]|uniref:hypothetical protein n=1 Tax=Salsuginibacillus kocurii TaxID=427078 RepID=UPI00037FD89E|nr:hypothetical protein [Salsuginibacillus kocurii]